MAEKSTNTSISLTNSDGSLASEFETAQIFSKHFLSVYYTLVERGLYGTTLPKVSTNLLKWNFPKMWCCNA